MTSLKQRLRDQQTVFGPFLKIANPAIVELLGHAGFDYLIIDAEHGPVSMETAEQLVRAANCVDISSIIRVTNNDPTLILRALDIGADGVQVPQVSTRRNAEEVARAAKYAPIGNRGVCCFTRAAGYGHKNKFDHFKEANQNVVVIIHIEGEEGIVNLDEILAVEGIDVIFIGPYDLSQSLGVPGEVSHPLVEQKMVEVVKKARQAGLIVGTFVESVESAHRWINLGVRYISYSVDTGIFYACLKEITGQLKGTDR